MKINIDLRSALFGLVMGIGVMFALGAGEPSAPGVGRYQAVCSQGFFMITDTVNGRAWCANAAVPGISGVPSGFFEAKSSR